ncbi:hypothetical protein [Streptomyces sp. ODS28]|uniref:hypothetical protein n=1 Tax=Streptomyces sp. ODS28 TaxID=3136688 RepID=UPI0031E99B4F
MPRTPSNSPAPGGPRNRTPVAVRTRRTPGDVLKAVLAFLALAALVAGVPAALAYFVGWPLPSGMVSLDTLQEEISARTFVNVLAVVVWIAWAQFAACVLVEVKAVVTGVGMPARVPGAGMSQMMARQLVAAILLLGSTAASFTPGLAQLGQAYQHQSQPPAAAAQQLPGQHAQGQQHGGAGQQADRAHDEGEQGSSSRMDKAHDGDKAEKDTKFYRIQPPEGRHHDSLWDIAQRHLDDGRRYKEIFELNKDRAQPDGSKLSEASLIRPGWILEMPADAHGGDLVEMPDDAPKVDQDLRDQIQDYQGAKDTAADEDGGAGQGDQAGQADQARQDGGAGHGEQAGDGGERAGDGSEQGGGEQDGAQHPGAGASEETPHEQGPGTEVTDGSESGGSFGWAESLVGAPLLAAGVLAALGRRRRAALWQSATGAVRGARGGAGREPAPLSDPAAAARDALLVGADPGAVRFLDRALRGLAAELAAQGRTLPTVYAAWLTDEGLHLQLAQEAGDPPRPWTFGQSPSFWSVERARLAEAESESAEGTSGGPAGTAAAWRPDASDPEEETTAPYPGLVSLGRRDDARLLLNLEAVPGLVSVTGGAEQRQDVLASVAAELATSGWADRMAVTLVGFGEELTALAPTRVNHVADLPGLLDAMEAETERRRGSLRTAGRSTVLTGRTASPGGQQQWAPHLVLIGTEPGEAEAERLAALAAGADALGIGYLVATGRTELPGAVWEFEVTGDHTLKAPLMGLELEGQLLPSRLRTAVAELFASADAHAQPDPGPGSGGGTAGADAGPRFRVDLSDRGRPDVYVRLMGPYEIIGLDEPEGARSVLLREALALLLLKREGVHPRVLASALWPKGVTADVRDALIERLTRWLGNGADGTPRLRTDDDGRLVLLESVVSDWDVLRTLHHGATGERGAKLSPALRHRQLSDALDLARGPLLSERPEGRYGWLAHELADSQQPLLVAEIGLELAAEHTGQDRPERAAEAVRGALRAAPGDERLWHELLRTEHATGDPERLDEAMEWITEQNRALHGPGRGLPARTQALLEELAPAKPGARGKASG